MNTQPPSWPMSAPDYHSYDGWLYEKKLAYNNVAFQVKDAHVCALINKAAELSEMAYIAFDVQWGYRLEAIVIRLVQYRINLLERYKPTELYGNCKIQG